MTAKKLRLYCDNTGGFKGLTRGGYYLEVDKNSNLYFLENDLGVTQGYPKNLFLFAESNMHDYQSTAKYHIIENLFSGLFLDMGLGKTVATLTAVKILLEDLDILKTLVIAPKRVAETVWSTECKKWEHLKDLRISKIIGTERQRRAALAEKADIYLISRDNIAWLIGLYGGSMLPFDMLVVDESSSFKNPKSQRFKALKRVQPSFKRVVLLTGTPAPNGLIDLWSQIYLLDRGERLGKTITSYRDNYFNPGQRNGHIVYNYRLQKDGESRIHARISDICMSMKAKDYLDLPETIYNDVAIRFPEKLQKQYDDFEREQVLELFEDQKEGASINAVNSAALSNKLLQFANGAIYDEDKNYHVVHDLKIEAVEELLENANGQPVLLAWTYRSDMYRLKKKLTKYDPRELKTEQDILDWNAGKIRLLMMHPASGGHGLNLQYGGHIIIWFGQTWSLELYLQLCKRLDRQGQTVPVIINRLIAHKTMDIDVISSQKSKDQTQEGLMRAIKSRINKYLKL
jgi:SNF2 family DNA or RNA helicase